jgi:hypothetical protein
MKNRLTYNNCWAADNYFVNKKRILTLKKVCINGTEYPVSNRSVSVRYTDMGHEGYGTSTHYFVPETVFGIKKEFDLNSLVEKVKVYAVEFTTEEK